NNFVAVWHDHIPEPGIWYDAFNARPFDSATGVHFTEEEINGYAEGRGAEIVFSYFCGPDGKLVHCLKGFWRTERYRAEAEFALQLLKQAREQPAAQRLDFQRSLLVQRIEELARERQGFGLDDVRWAELLEQSFISGNRLLDRPLGLVLQE